MEKEIDIVYQGKPAKATIRRLGWAEKNTLGQQYVSVKIVGKLPQVDTKTLEMRTGVMLKCLKKAPFIPEGKVLEIQQLNEEDPVMLEKIYDEIDKYNDFDADTKKKSQGSSGEQKKENLTG